MSTRYECHPSGLLLIFPTGKQTFVPYMAIGGISLIPLENDNAELDICNHAGESIVNATDPWNIAGKAYKNMVTAWNEWDNRRWKK